MRNLMNRIETFWCEHMHTATLWPIHGKYRCASCLREYPVDFEAIGTRPAGRAPASPVAVSI